MITGNAIAAQYTSYSGETRFRIYAIAPGFGSITCTELGKSRAFYVLDVIPNSLDLTVGGNYTFSPVIDSSMTPLTWSSSNTSVATVDANGMLTRIAAKSYITPWFSGGGFFGGAFGCTMDFTFPIGLGLISSRL